MIWGRRRVSADAAARVLRARAGRLARLRHAPAPAVHALAPQLRRDRRGARAARWHAGRLRRALAAFFLAVGIGAHALDELQRPPARHADPGTACSSGSPPSSIAAAVAIGIVGAIAFDLWLLAVRRGRGVLVCAYNLELFGGRLHTDVWFALAWGAFPLLTAYFGAAERSASEAVLAAAFAALSATRSGSLSTQVRMVQHRDVGLPDGGQRGAG